MDMNKTFHITKVKLYSNLNFVSRVKKTSPNKEKVTPLQSIKKINKINGNSFPKTDHNLMTNFMNNRRK